MDRISELLALIEQLAELDDEALATLRADLIEAGGELAGQETLTAAEVAAIRDAAQARVAIDAEISTRAADAAELAAEAQAALDLLRGEGEEAAADGDETEPEPEVEESAAEEGEPQPIVAEDEPEPEAVEAPEAIAAAASRRPAVTSLRPRIPRAHQPRQTNNPGGLENITASGDVPGMGAGQAFESVEQLGGALADKAEAIGASRGNDGEKFYVARQHRHFPPDRMITTAMSAVQIGDMVERVTGREALVAAGGFCAPPDVDYRITTWGQTDRPVASALPSFSAPHGQVQIIPSPTLADIVVDNTGGAIDTFTAAEDVSGSAYPKTVQEITCADPVTVSMYARTLQFKNGNWAERFYPERMRAFVGLGEVAFARDGDKKLLQLIKAGSTDYANTPAEFGAYRDLKRQFLGVMAELDDVLRDYSVNYRMLLPGYIPAMLATDLLAQQPGDSAWDITLERMRSEVEGWSSRVRVTWTRDSVRTDGRLLSTPAQPAGPGAPRSATFDADVEWAIFPEGGWVHLDGGTLDLGVVRDSTLNAANRFQTFFEEWETVAHVAGPSLWITSSLCAGGDSQVATDIAACGTSGS